MTLRKYTSSIRKLRELSLTDISTDPIITGTTNVVPVFSVIIDHRDEIDYRYKCINKEAACPDTQLVFYIRSFLSKYDVNQTSGAVKLLPFRYCKIPPSVVNLKVSLYE